MTNAALIIGLIGVLAVSACQPSPAERPTTPPGREASAGAPAAASAPAASAAGAPAAGQGALLPKPAPLQPPVPVSVGQLASGGDLPLFVALERGYFQEEGLEINLVHFRTSAEMTPLLASGQLDIGLGGVNAGFFNSVAQGIPLKIVADKVVTDKSAAWMVRSELLDSGQVKEARDFKGLTLGFGSVGSIIDVEMDRILKDGGLTAEDVTIKQVAYPDQVVAFANKSIDAAYVFEPTRTRLLDVGLAKVWKTSGEIYPNHESVVLIYGPTMDSKLEAGKRFMVGYLRGVREFKEQGLDRRDANIVEIAVKWTDIKDPELWYKMELQQGNPDGYNYRASLEFDLNWFAANGFVPRAPRLDDALDQSFVDYAISRLGRYKPGCGSNPCP